MNGQYNIEGFLIQKFNGISSKKNKLLFICRTLQNFRKDEYLVNPMIADNFLAAVLPFMETNLEFSESYDEWISALVGIIEDYAASRRHGTIREYSFCYHDSYEKAIFVILSMVETSKVLKIFVAALNKLHLIKTVVKSLSEVLQNDISYATQEIALDVLCRIAMYYTMAPRSDEGVAFVSELLLATPETIKRALKDTTIGPKGILVDMRPSLNEINKASKNVRSCPIISFGIEVIRSLPYKRKISGASWLDFSRDKLTIYIPEKDILVKILYQMVVRVHFATSSNTAQICLESMPDNLESVIQHDERNPKGKPIFFFVEFGGGNLEILENARELFANRLENAEAIILTDSREQRKKYSIVSSRDNASQDPETAVVANDEFLPENMSNSVVNTRFITVVTASKLRVRAHDEEKLSAVSSPESMPRKKKSLGTEHEENLPSRPTPKHKSSKLGGIISHEENELQLESSFDIENNEYAQLSPKESNNVMAVVSLKDSRGRKKVTSNKKQKITPEDSLKSAVRDAVYASPTMHIPGARPTESKRPLIGVESAKSVTSIARNESTLSRRGNENVDPQSSFGWSRNLKFENSTNTRRRRNKGQISPVSIHAKPTRIMRSPTSAANYVYENKKTIIPAPAITGYRVATEDKSISDERRKTRSEDLQPAARMRSRGSVDSHKQQDKSEAISLSRNELLTATTVAEHHPGKSIAAEASQQHINVDHGSQSQSDIAIGYGNLSSDHYHQGQIEEGNVINDNNLSTEVTNEFQKTTTSWRFQNVLTSPLKSENESFVIGVSLPSGNGDLKNSDAVKPVMEYVQNKIEHDSHSAKGFRRPLDVGVLLSNYKTRSRNYEIRGDEVVTGFNDSRSKSDEDSSPKDRLNVDLAVDKSDDGEPSSDEDGVIAMLLEELVTMQKSRASRKRARLMTGAVTAASVQVKSYLLQLSDFNESTCMELESSTKEQLESLCNAADLVCESLTKKLQKFDEIDRKLSARHSGIEKDLEIMYGEISTALTMQQREEITFRGNLTTKWEKVFDSAKKINQQLNRDRSANGASGSRQNTKQLMLALRDL